jgi:hypothetical protein
MAIVSGATGIDANESNEALAAVETIAFVFNNSLITDAADILLVRGYNSYSR